MGVFEHFPYTNFHDLNLDWIVQELEKLSGDVRDFISINAIKYANPIQWDITSQYEKNTVVLDKDGNAFLSVQPVPAGVSLDRTEYWTNIGNFSALWESVKNAITIPDEGHETTASAPRAVNDLVWVNNKLLEVTSAMLAGDQYIIGSNCRLFSMQIFLKETLAALSEEKVNRENADTAIEEKLDTEIETRKNLQTDFEKYIEGIKNAKMYGIKGDGVTDDTAAIKTLVAGGGNIYFPEGVYLISDTIEIDVLGTTISGQLGNYHPVNVNGTQFKNISTKPTFKIKTGCEISNLCLYGSNLDADGITCESVDNFLLENLTIIGHGNGINIAGSNWSHVNNCHVSQCSKNGFLISGGTLGVALVQITNCLSEKNAGAGFYFLHGTGASTALGSFINNSTFANTRGGVIYDGVPSNKIGGVRIVGGFLGGDGGLGEIYIGTCSTPAQITGVYIEQCDMVQTGPNVNTDPSYKSNSITVIDSPTTIADSTIITSAGCGVISSGPVTINGCRFSRCGIGSGVTDVMRKSGVLLASAFSSVTGCSFKNCENGIYNFTDEAAIYTSNIFDTCTTPIANTSSKTIDANNIK